MSRTRSLVVALLALAPLAGCGDALDQPGIDKKTTVTVTTSSSGSPTSSPTSPAERPEPPTDESGRPVFTKPGQGYNCPGTDAWVVDKKYCTPEVVERYIIIEEWYIADDWDEYEDAFDDYEDIEDYDDYGDYEDYSDDVGE